MERSTYAEGRVMPGSAPPPAPKAKLSAAALEISAQTLRYWRKELDPEPRNEYFSSGRLLAYRVLKVLIRHRGIDVEELKRCDCEALFEACTHVAWDVLARSYLYVDRKEGVLFLHHAELFIDKDDYDAECFALAGIVAMHRAMWERLGFNGTVRRELLPPNTAAPPRHAPIIRRKELRPKGPPSIDLSVLYNR